MFSSIAKVRHKQIPINPNPANGKNLSLNSPRSSPNCKFRAVNYEFALKFGVVLFAISYVKSELPGGAMPEKISEKVWIAIINVIGSVLTAVITTYGVIAVNGRGIAENQRLNVLSEKATDLQKRILPIGTVTASPLTPAEFASQVSDPDTFDIQHSKWVLADGRAVSGTGWASRFVRFEIVTETPQHA